MRHTQYPTPVPTRTTLRRAPARAADAVPVDARHVAVACTALTAFLAGTVVLAVAVAGLVAALPANPLALLGTVASATVAVHALPLFAVRAAVRVARATE